MTEACATCGADDELLFTCRYCERRFCERHELPHHACERFRGTGTETTASGGSAAAARSADEPGTATAATESEPATTAQTAATRETTDPPESTPSSATTGDGGTVRPMDSRRAVGVVSPASSPRTLGEWLTRQTYLTLLFKVGGLALLINAAFYGGMALTLYDPFGLL